MNVGNERGETRDSNLQFVLLVLIACWRAFRLSLLTMFFYEVDNVFEVALADEFHRILLVRCRQIEQRGVARYGEFIRELIARSVDFGNFDVGTWEYFEKYSVTINPRL